ncbi:uncharacterized protein LOC142582908 isoform X2 [Dermacentor variabilis]|uniref:uncharacterized protein LOC142582908 isoform X2 n=1 Tax=Dermacentor variabilis TaxID=34621 RepID=UPI003F5B5E29
MRTFNVTGKNGSLLCPCSQKLRGKPEPWLKEGKGSLPKPRLHGPAFSDVSDVPLSDHCFITAFLQCHHINNLNMRRSALVVVMVVLLMTELLWTVLAEDIEREEQYGKLGFGEDQEEAGLFGKIKAIPKKIDFSRPFDGFF